MSKWVGKGDGEPKWGFDGSTSVKARGEEWEKEARQQALISNNSPH